jgi:hypothetical protein
MTRGRGTKTPDEGAMTPVMLAVGDIGGKTGEFWQNEKGNPMVRENWRARRKTSGVVPRTKIVLEGAIA